MNTNALTPPAGEQVIAEVSARMESLAASSAPSTGAFFMQPSPPWRLPSAERALCSRLAPPPGSSRLRRRTTASAPPITATCLSPGRRRPPCNSPVGDCQKSTAGPRSQRRRRSSIRRHGTCPSFSSWRCPARNGPPRPRQPTSGALPRTCRTVGIMRRTRRPSVLRSGF